MIQANNMVVYEIRLATNDNWCVCYVFADQVGMVMRVKAISDQKLTKLHLSLQ